MATEILVKSGRLVAGDAFKSNDKDAQGRPKLTKAGQPKITFYIGVAIPKNDPDWPKIWASMQQTARTGFPHLFDADGNLLPGAKFSWKLTDGDSAIPNEAGKIPNKKEGYAGHWVLNFSSQFPPRCFKLEPNGQYAQIVDPNELKCGYYVQVYGNCAPNRETAKPGLYLNHTMIALVGYGQEIISGPDPNAVFGGVPQTLPPGASQTPVAPNASISIPQGIQPAHDFLNPPPTIKYMAANGQTYTKDELLKAGWNEQQITALPTVL